MFAWKRTDRRSWKEIGKDAKARNLFATELAAELGLHPNYVRQRLRKHNASLPAATPNLDAQPIKPPPIAARRKARWDRLFAEMAPGGETVNDFCRRAGCSSSAALDQAALRNVIFARSNGYRRRHGL